MENFHLILAVVLAVILVLVGLGYLVSTHVKGGRRGRTHDGPGR